MKNEKKVPGSLQLQFYLLIALLGLGIYSIFNFDYFIFFEMMLTLLLFLMAYNNHKVYKRKYMTVLYIVCAVIFALSIGVEIGIYTLS